MSELDSPPPAAVVGELHAGIVKSRRYIGRRIVIEARDTDEQLLLLKGRWRSTLDELSPRELEVAQRYARGDTYAVIARERGVAPSTVRNQLYRVFRKIHVNNKTELAMRLFESSGAA